VGIFEVGEAVSVGVDVLEAGETIGTVVGVGVRQSKPKIRQRISGMKIGTKQAITPTRIVIAVNNH
jgi:hypothetical protein